MFRRRRHERHGSGGSVHPTEVASFGTRCARDGRRGCEERRVWREPGCAQGLVWLADPQSLDQRRVEVKID